MKNLIIIGARGYGRGTYDIALSMTEYGSEFVVKGYLDDKEDALNNFSGYPPILSSVEDYQIEKDDVFICALGDVKYKKKYINIILAKGGEFFTLVHSAASIGKNVKIGKGCIIGAGSFIDCDAVIGDFVNIQMNAVIGHDSIIGDWSMIDCFAFTGGFARIGEGVTLHTRATIIPKLEVGDYAVVNACSLCIRKVKPNSVMLGNPAKELLIPQVNK